MRKRSIRLWWALPLVLLAAIVGFIAWATLIPAPMPEAQLAMQSNEQVTFKEEAWLIFQPTENDPTTGLIFYPGGRVDYRAYTPAAQAIAAEGYMVVIVPMPLNLAVLSPERAADVIEAFPRIQHWAIGGHSLGGAMAAQFAHTHPDQVQGLVLWASYPAGSADLSTRDLEVVSIFGTRDGLATGDKIEASRALLPRDTRMVPIDGGNHAQFGWYGPQNGDNEATISRIAQQDQVIAATVELLRDITTKD